MDSWPFRPFPFMGREKMFRPRAIVHDPTSTRPEGYFLSEVPIYVGLFQIASSSFSCFFPTSKCEKKIHNSERTYSLWPDFELQQNWCMEPNEVLKSSSHISHLPRPKRKKCRVICSKSPLQALKPSLCQWSAPAPGTNQLPLWWLHGLQTSKRKKKNIVPPKLKPNKTTLSDFSASPWIVILYVYIYICM